MLLWSVSSWRAIVLMMSWYRSPFDERGSLNWNESKDCKGKLFEMHIWQVLAKSSGEVKISLFCETLLRKKDKLVYLWLTLTSSLTKVRYIAHNLKCSSAHTQGEVVTSGLAFPCQRIAHVPILWSLSYHHIQSMKENEWKCQNGKGEIDG